MSLFWYCSILTRLIRAPVSFHCAINRYIEKVQRLSSRRRRSWFNLACFYVYLSLSALHLLTQPIAQFKFQTFSNSAPMLSTAIIISAVFWHGAFGNFVRWFWNTCLLSMKMINLCSKIPRSCSSVVAIEKKLRWHIWLTYKKIVNSQQQIPKSRKYCKKYSRFSEIHSKLIKTCFAVWKDASTGSP